MHPKWQVRKGKRENKGYEKFIRSKPCIICGKSPVEFHHCWHRRNDVFSGVPLCNRHHVNSPDAYHVIEHENFERRHNINLLEVIYELLTEFIESEMI